MLPGSQPRRAQGPRRSRAAFEPKFWKMTGSVTPIRSATSETFAARYPAWANTSVAACRIVSRRSAAGRRVLRCAVHVWRRHPLPFNLVHRLSLVAAKLSRGKEVAAASTRLRTTARRRQRHRQPRLDRIPAERAGEPDRVRRRLPVHGGYGLSGLVRRLGPGRGIEQRLPARKLAAVAGMAGARHRGGPVAGGDRVRQRHAHRRMTFIVGCARAWTCRIPPSTLSPARSRCHHIRPASGRRVGEMHRVRPGPADAC